MGPARGGGLQLRSFGNRRLAWLGQAFGIGRCAKPQSGPQSIAVGLNRNAGGCSISQKAVQSGKGGPGLGSVGLAVACVS